MGKIGQNPKIVQIWRSVAPQTYVVHRREKLTGPSKLPGRWTTTRCKQYLSAVHHMTCSLLWVWCLFDGFSIPDFWGKWPLKWKFSKMSLWIPRRDTMFRVQIWWKSAVAKLPKGPLDYHTIKNLGSAILVPTPILPKMGRLRPKFPECCYPLTCPHTCISNLVRIGCGLPDLFRKDWFFGPKSNWKL